MPADSSKRLSGPRDHSQPTVVAQSPGDHHTSQKQGSTSSHKRHVASSSRLVSRNSSYGRNLSKLTITAVKDDEGGNKGTNGPPVSPRHKPGGKRNPSQVSLMPMPRNASGTVLRKNLSSGHLTRNSSGKHLSKSHRPDYQRTRSHDERKSKPRVKSPSRHPQKERHASVRFDIGDDEDDGEEMEGVDDAWTEESASQSPETTRDNTRSNTRSNSVVLDAAVNPRKTNEDMPPDKGGSSDESSTKEAEDAQQEHETSPTVSERKSSYQEAMHQSKALDAEAIAKRLLQRNESRISHPQVSDVSVTTSSNSPHDPSQGSLPRLQAHASPSRTSLSSSSTNNVSRFIEPSDSAPGSKDGTPRSPVAAVTASGSITQVQSKAEKQHHQQQQQRSTSRRDRDRERDAHIRRNKSTPSFILPPSSPPPGHEGGSGTGSGASTPGGPLRQSRTQQKLWLQRGLSNIEANSQSNLQGLLMGGSSSGGAANGSGGGGGGGVQGAGLVMRRGVNGFGASNGGHHHGVGGIGGVGDHGRNGGFMGFAVGPGGGAALGVGERIERELAAVRRYRHPIEESIERLRKVKQGGGGGVSVGGGGPKSNAASSAASGRTLASGAKTPASVSVSVNARSRTNSPGGMARSSFNSAGSAEDEGAAAGEGRPARDWVGLSLDELEEATLEVRRQMWELQSMDVED